MVPASVALRRRALGPRLDDDAVAHVLAGFGELPAHPDVEPAMRELADGGVRTICLTNGAADTTEAFLAREGLGSYVERVVATAEIRSWKPPAHVYRHALEVLGEPAEMSPSSPRTPGIVTAPNAWAFRPAGSPGWSAGTAGCSPLRTSPATT